MKIFIKNMVCIRCKMAVKSELENLQIQFRTIELGEVETIDNISQEKLIQLDNNLRLMGLELTKNKKTVLAEKIRTSIIEIVNCLNDQTKICLTDYLPRKLNYNYTFLAKVFSEVKGITIEKFYITYKIERIKELLIYHDLSLNEISFITQYSSIAHMSGQFKKLTGLTPSQYRHLKYNNRIQAEKIAC